MTATAFLDLTSWIAGTVVLLAVLACVFRVVRGPSLADRILGLELMTTLGVCLIGIVAVRAGLTVYLDVAIGLALVGFLATVAFSRFLQRLHRQQQERQDG